jgi:levansucrase
MFDPSGPTGPTALYGMVADSVLGPYQPLNGSGLVAATPAAEPRQSYSWWVCDDLSVVSFVDHWGLSGRSISDDLVLNRAQFGGTPAPVFKLSLDGNCAKIDTV